MQAQTAQVEQEGKDIPVMLFCTAVASLPSLLIHAKVIKRGLRGFLGGLSTSALGATGSQLGMYEGDEPPDIMLGALLATLVASPATYFKSVGWSWRSVAGYLLLLVVGYLTPPVLSFTIHLLNDLLGDPTLGGH